MSEDPAPEKTSISLNPLENAVKTLLLDVARLTCENPRYRVRGTSDGVVRFVELYFSGGWVRDKLRGVDSPRVNVMIRGMYTYDFCQAIRDYLWVPGNAEKYENMLPNSNRKLGPVSVHRYRANNATGEDGKCMVANIFGLYIGFANPRRSASRRSSLREVIFGSLSVDAYNRDATVNSIFYNLQETRVEDLTGRGLVDLHNRVLRTPVNPYTTLQNDPARILRLIRLSCDLHYRISGSVLKAMQDEYIIAPLSAAYLDRHLMRELNKILRGLRPSPRRLNGYSLDPGRNPRRALHLIDKLGLYPSLFGDHDQDIDTSQWHCAYDTLWRLKHPQGHDSVEFKESARDIRNALLRHPDDTYNAWVIALFLPLFHVSTPSVPGSRPRAPRIVEVAKARISAVLSHLVELSLAHRHYRDVIDAKSSVVDGGRGQTDAEIREQVVSCIQSCGSSWRTSVITAILHEAINGHNVPQGKIPLPSSEIKRLLFAVVQDYGRFLKWCEQPETE